MKIAEPMSKLQLPNTYAMPRLRSNSINITSTRSTRSAVRKCAIGSLDTNAFEVKQTGPIRSILKQTNSATTDTRRARNSVSQNRSALATREPVKEEKRAQHHRSTSLHKGKEPAPSTQTKTKRTVAGRKRSTDPQKPKASLDPYAFEALVDSDDEKENIDPKRSVHPIAKSSSAMPKPQMQPRIKVRKGRETVTKQIAPVFTSPIATLTARPSVHFGPSKRVGSGLSPGRLSTGPSIAELERRKNASATILLSLPKPSGPTFHNSSVLSVSNLALTQVLSASTPASQIASATAAHVANKAIPSSCTVALSPINTTVPTLARVPPEAQFHQVTQRDEEAHPIESALQHPTEPHSYSHSEEKDERTGSSRGHSSGSHSNSSSHRRHRKMSDSDREEAYTSWLDEFNAELEKFESHELTVIDDKSPE